MSLSELVLILHSFTRWAVLSSSIATALGGLTGAVTDRAWVARDRIIARVFVACVDLQVLLGLSLYFGVSPTARAARVLWASAGLGGLWADHELRFFGIIHPTLVLLAACTTHASWVAARRTERADERHRRIGIGAALALAVFLAAIPWPFLGHERPWFRF
jgi:hypothetical protein